MNGHAKLKCLIVALLVSVSSSVEVLSQEQTKQPVVLLSGTVGSRWYLDYFDLGQSVATAVSIGVRPSSDDLSIVLEAAFASSIGTSDFDLKVLSAQIERTIPFAKRLFVGAGAGAALWGTAKGFTPVISSGYRFPINNTVELSPKLTYWNPRFNNWDTAAVVLLSIQGSVLFR